MDSRKANRLVIALSFAVIAFVGLASPFQQKGRTDFVSFYAGARLAGSPHLYSPAHVRETQIDVEGPSYMRAFVRPAFYAVLLRPLAWLPYFSGLVVWQLLNLGALAAFVMLWQPRAFAAALCCFYLPVWINLSASQDGMLVLLCAWLSVRLLGKGRHFSAGMLLSLCSVKFPLFLLIPVFIVARRLWRFGAGLAAGGAVLFIVSCIAGGWNWLAEYLALLEVNERAVGAQQHMLSVYGLFYGLPNSTVWTIVGSLAVVLGTWYAVRHTVLELAFALTLFGGMLVSLHSFGYDLTFLLPVFLVLAQSGKPGTAIFLWAATALSMVGVSLSQSSFVGQSGLLLVFCWVVYRAFRNEMLPEEI